MGPKNKKNYPLNSDELIDNLKVSSTGDCTGLVPAEPASHDEAEAYDELLDIPNSKIKEHK